MTSSGYAGRRIRVGYSFQGRIRHQINRQIGAHQKINDVIVLRKLYAESTGRARGLELSESHYLTSLQLRGWTPGGQGQQLNLLSLNERAKFDDEAHKLFASVQTSPKFVTVNVVIETP
jgi:hypothetical protein